MATLAGRGKRKFGSAFISYDNSTPVVVNSRSCNGYNNRVPAYHDHSPTGMGPPPPPQPIGGQSAWQQHNEQHTSPHHSNLLIHASPSQAVHDMYPSPTPALSMSNPLARVNTSDLSIIGQHSTSSTNLESKNFIPHDPREWTPYDVSLWIYWATNAYKLRNAHPERFQMNGKALCLMDLSMFVYRVPDGGERLYQDFQTRLQKALYEDKLR